MSDTLDESAVRHVAHLARLKISDEEVARFAVQLSAILKYMDQLNEVETDDVPPTAHALELANVLRDDSIRTPCSAAEAIRNAPQSQDTFFRVPKVLDQESA